jgi:hypothetical protein
LESPLLIPSDVIEERFLPDAFFPVQVLFVLRSLSSLRNGHPIHASFLRWSLPQSVDTVSACNSRRHVAGNHVRASSVESLSPFY